MIILKRTLDKRYIDPAILLHILGDYVDEKGEANAYLSELKLLSLCRDYCRKEFPK